MLVVSTILVAFQCGTADAAAACKVMEQHSTPLIERVSYSRRNAISYPQVWMLDPKWNSPAKSSTSTQSSHQCQVQHLLFLRGILKSGHRTPIHDNDIYTRLLHMQVKKQEGLPLIGAFNPSVEALIS
jgi:hypothetical protein